ncbi:hypothetical protein KFL_014100010 [Klebsormidium nitens]|uniref:Uncharacterized protein n=1 Tax=Klebsormidium nitens TaxID=105231 RepID=A0A1Y1IX04_KLENI|nr:hypothetical protein KFL_014100010 [Klebsormidium nitens]|eukprot:GAQ93277.1 hypothetical protein KFL_014100010 [Klebsormidium nitens]
MSAISARIANLNTALGRAQNQIGAANANAVARVAALSKFESKESGPDICQWLHVIEEYLNATPNAEYLRIVSSYLDGKRRSYWISAWEAWQAADPGAYLGSAVPGSFVGNARHIARDCEEGPPKAGAGKGKGQKKGNKKSEKGFQKDQPTHDSCLVRRTLYWI